MQSEGEREEEGGRVEEERHHSGGANSSSKPLTCAQASPLAAKSSGRWWDPNPTSHTALLNFSAAQAHRIAPDSTLPASSHPRGPGPSSPPHLHLRLIIFRFRRSVSRGSNFREDAGRSVFVRSGAGLQASGGMTGDVIYKERHGSSG